MNLFLNTYIASFNKSLNTVKTIQANSGLEEKANQVLSRACKQDHQSPIQALSSAGTKAITNFKLQHQSPTLKNRNHADKHATVKSVCRSTRQLPATKA